MNPTTSTNPKDKIGRTKPPLHLIPSTANIVESMVFALGAKKYGPYNWRDNTVSAVVYIDAFDRHRAAWLDGQNDDPESGISHLGHMRACLAIIIDAMESGTLVDDRPKPGASARLISKYTSSTQRQLIPQASIDRYHAVAQGGNPDGGNIENGNYAEGFEEVEAHSLKAMLTQKAQDEAKLVALGCSPKVAGHIVGGITYCGVQNAPYVYIAGPMRGYPQFNFPAFDAARDRFVTAGFNVISPADIDRAAGDENCDDQTTFVYRDFYAIFFLKVGTENNGMIAVLPRFEKSTGTTAEFFLARWLGLPILSAISGDKLTVMDVCEADLLTAFEDFIKGQ